MRRYQYSPITEVHYFIGIASYSVSQSVSQSVNQSINQSINDQSDSEFLNAAPRSWLWT